MSLVRIYPGKLVTTQGGEIHLVTDRVYNVFFSYWMGSGEKRKSDGTMERIVLVLWISQYHRELGWEDAVGGY